MPDKLPSVREHADAIIDGLVKDGKIAPDASSAARATGIPTFSKGTATLDENTGKPIAPKVEPPSFGETGVAMPEGQQSAQPLAAPVDGAAPVHAAPVAPAAAPSGAPVADAAPEGAPAGQAAGAAAAEAAAQAVADAFAEYEELEVEDADLDVKYPIRVPKQYATSAKRGYPRRAAYDRATSYLKNAEPVLRQLIEDGRMNQILPLIQRALSDPAYGEYAWQGYERAQRGLPLIEQARQEAQQAAAAQADPSTQFDPLEIEDPFFAERVKPLVQKYETLEQKLSSIEQERQQQRTQQQEQYQLNQRRATEMQSAHQDLARTIPDLYSGDLQRDNAIWMRTLQYAKESGYVDAYGLRAGIIFAGQQVNIMEQERLAATASPSATALHAAEAKHLDLARQQAAQASRTVGAGAPTHATPAAPMPMPTPRNPDGSLKPAAQYLREQQDYLQSQRQPA